MAVAAISQPVTSGRVFTACQQAGVTTAADFNTDCKPIALFNPANSQVNLIIRWAAWTASVAFTAAATVFLAGNASGTTTGTAATVWNALIGNSNQPTGRALVTATLPATPTGIAILGQGLTGAITTIPSTPWYVTRFDGDIVVAPGATVSFQTKTASGASGFWSAISWEERGVSSDPTPA